CRYCGQEGTPCPSCAALEAARPQQPPVTPAGSTPSHESPKEDTMQQIEESRLAQLEADAGRVQALESERDASNAERDAERARRVAAENRAAAVQALADSSHTFTALERRGLLAELPVVEESGELDVEAFTAAIDEAATERGATTETGLTGFGSTAAATKVGEATDPWADIDTHLNIVKEASVTWQPTA